MKTEEKENEWAVKEWWLTFTIFNTYGFFCEINYQQSERKHSPIICYNEHSSSIVIGMSKWNISRSKITRLLP